MATVMTLELKGLKFQNLYLTQVRLESRKLKQCLAQRMLLRRQWVSSSLTPPSMYRII